MPEVQVAGEFRPYRPSNGAEGEFFMAEWCANCAKIGDVYGETPPCSILTYALAHNISDPDYPAQWQYTTGGRPQCTAFLFDAPSEVRCPETPDLFLGEAE